MKKAAIPAMLAATVLVAGMFALMPVQRAQTIHTNILDTNLANVPTTAASNCSTNLRTDMLEAKSNRDFVIHFVISAPTTDQDISIDDGLGGAATFTFTLKNGLTISGILYYPGSTTETKVTISDTDVDATDAKGCATVITEGGGRASVT